jgi:diadenosine tetraphosphatase ApaH/serine/threonine PP2A family protein phosphatase
MLALLYDVHGNLPALEAVLADCPADRFLLGGDYAAFGGWPRECVERLQQLEDAVWIRGNTERWLADDSEVPPDAPQRPALQAAREALGDHARWLSELREGVTLAEGVFCHASPLNDMESFAPEPQPGEDRLLAGAKGPRIVFGHTHVLFTRTRDDGTELVNPGSVGMPLDGDHRAAYALIADNTVELRRVEYDVERAAAAAERSAGELFARRIREARP